MRRKIFPSFCLLTEAATLSSFAGASVLDPSTSSTTIRLDSLTSSGSSSSEDNLGLLDYFLDTTTTNRTNREPQLFHRPTAPFRKNGYTYRDDIEMEVKAAVTDLFVFPLAARLRVSGETLMKRIDFSAGSLVLLALVNAQIDLESPFWRILCDSYNHPCPDLDAFVGVTETIILDQQGNPLDIILPDGEIIDLEHYWEEEDDNNRTVTPAVLESQSQQFFKLIPDHPVSPGDSWDVDEDLGALGSFVGESSLEGYVNYDGVDCALLSFEGTLRLDMSLLAQLLGFGDDGNDDGTADPIPLSFPNRMADAKVRKKMLWDYNEEIARVVEIDFITTFTIYDKHGVVVHLPVDVRFAWTTDIIDDGSPPPPNDDNQDDDDDDDDDDTKNQQEEEEVSQSSYYKDLLGASLANHGRVVKAVQLDPSASSRSTILFGMVAVLAIAGFVFRRHHRRYSQYQQLY